MISTKELFKKVENSNCSNCNKKINKFKFSYDSELNKFFCNYQCRTLYFIKSKQ